MDSVAFSASMSAIAPESVLVIIPALNEAATVAGVVHELQARGLRRICVVDNGSCDRTAQVARQAGATVVEEPRRGYGQACWRGLQTAAAEWILFCDADGSDDLGVLPQWLAAGQEYDLILGNRRGTAAGRASLTPVQNFGNGLATALMRWGWGHRYRDLGPLRLVRRAALERIAMEDRGFGWTIEMQVRAVEEQLRIWEPPVDYRPRQGGRSKISGTLRGSVQAGTIILSTLAGLYRRRHQRLMLGLSAALMVLGALVAMPHGDFLNRPGDLYGFWLGMGLMGAGFMTAWGLERVSGRWFWGVAIAARLALLPMVPGDDIWRYLWEGYIQTQGFSPYVFSPDAAALAPLRTSWWPLINHPHISAIYPPVTQLGFWLLALVGPSVLLFKLAFVAADLGVGWLLSRRYGRRATLLYAWNPLVIYSFAGGGHYDGWFVLPLVAAWLWHETRPRLSALALGMSIAVKWVSLPLLGFVLWRQRRRPVLAAALLLLGLAPILLTALPFCSASSCPLVPVDSDFITRGRSAELVPYVVSLMWPASVTMNGIYALPLGLLVLGLLARSQRFGHFAEAYLAGLLLLSPVVHAWYFTWLVPFAVASRSWGIRLVSLSAFVYFVLPHRLSLGGAWQLTALERGLLWLPLLVGAIPQPPASYGSEAEPAKRPQALDSRS